MLYKLLECITNTKRYKNYEATRLLLDSITLTITNEYVKSLTKSSEDIDMMHKQSLKATEIRNEFCNKHIIYTKIFDYIFKKAMEES